MNKHATTKQTTLRKLILTTTACIGASLLAHAQSSSDTLLTKINPAKWSALVEKKLSKLEHKLIAKSEKTLHRLQKQEEKIFRKQLTTKDSTEAKAKLAEIESKYKSLAENLKNPGSVIRPNAGQYIPHLDTLKTAFKF